MLNLFEKQMTSLCIYINSLKSLNNDLKLSTSYHFTLKFFSNLIISKEIQVSENLNSIFYLFDCQRLKHLLMYS